LGNAVENKIVNQFSTSTMLLRELFKISPENKYATLREEILAD